MSPGKQGEMCRRVGAVRRGIVPRLSTVGSSVLIALRCLLANKARCVADSQMSPGKQGEMCRRVGAVRRGIVPRLSTVGSSVLIALRCLLANKARCVAE
ncbi:hypothetical protein J6590_015669 [Homalodisca vitripennis]|nr:hypothetical protein J6590_015669 [Homalodisca vitripennis]